MVSSSDKFIKGNIFEISGLAYLQTAKENHLTSKWSIINDVYNAK